MGRLSAKLRSIGDGKEYSGIGFWCPACDGVHVIRTGPVGGWRWDGNVEAPTIEPSIKVTTHENAVCHSFVRAGMIQFLGDCTVAVNGTLQPHPMANQTVSIPDWPYAEGEYGGV